MRAVNDRDITLHSPWLHRTWGQVGPGPLQIYYRPHHNAHRGGKPTEVGCAAHRGGVPTEAVERRDSGARRGGSGPSSGSWNGLRSPQGHWDRRWESYGARRGSGSVDATFRLGLYLGYHPETRHQETCSTGLVRDRDPRAGGNISLEPRKLGTASTME